MKMPTAVEKSLDMHEYTSVPSSSMETNNSISGTKQSHQMTTKIPLPNRRRKQDDDEPNLSGHPAEREVSNSTIFEAVKNLTSMVETFNSRLNENTLAIANLAKSSDFNFQEIDEYKDKVETL